MLDAEGQGSMQIIKKRTIDYMNRNQAVMLEKIAEFMGHSCLNIFKNTYQKNRSSDDFKFPDLHYLKKITQTTECRANLNKKTGVRCYDCIVHACGVICQDCFQMSDHEGHTYQLYQVKQGFCDCGDNQLWKVNGFCKNHKDKQQIQQLKKKIDQQEMSQFVAQLGYCFAYLFVQFHHYQVICSIFPQNISSQPIQKQLKEVDLLGEELINYLKNFSQQSLISKMMIFQMLKSKLNFLKQWKLQLSFCQESSNLSILEIFFKCRKLLKTFKAASTLFTDLFELKQFKKQCSIHYFSNYNRDSQFAICQFSQNIKRRLLESHQTIEYLVQNKKVKPLYYCQIPTQQLKTSLIQIKSYFENNQYLLRLNKQSRQKYFIYYIETNHLPYHSFHRILLLRKSISLNGSIANYQIQQKFIGQLIKILNTVRQSQKELTLLEIALKDYLSTIDKIYQTNLKNVFNYQLSDQYSINFVYITHELALSMLIFMYFQKLQDQYGNEFNENSKISKLLQVLNLKDFSQSKDKILKILKVLNNHLQFAGLSLGHQKTRTNFKYFVSVTFKANMNNISLLYYLYSTLIKILVYIHKQNNVKMPASLFQSDNIFNSPFQKMLKIFQKDQFESDDQRIQYRKKIVIKLSHFINLIIQATQTDVHEIILATTFGYQNKLKYQKRIFKFYLEILKNYKKINIKEYKQICDSFFVSDDTFLNFIRTCKQIDIVNGKISLKQSFQFQVNKQEISQQSPQKNIPNMNKLTDSSVNLYYFKSFKHQLQKINQSQSHLVTPLSQNHLSQHIFSESYVKKLINVISLYAQFIYESQGRIKQMQINGLGELMIQLIKIYHVYVHLYGKNCQIATEIIIFLRQLHEVKDILKMFPQNVQRIILPQIINKNEANQIQEKQQGSKQKISQIKRKLIAKRNKKLTKFKQSQQKCQMKFYRQIQDIRLLEQQQKNQTQHKNGRICVVCHQGQNAKDYKKSGLNVMCYIQISNLYNHLLKSESKKISKQNYNLAIKACGHYTHYDCYKKLPSPKPLDYCIFCKSKFNFMFSTKVFHYEELQKKLAEHNDKQKILQEQKTKKKQLQMHKRAIKQSIDKMLNYLQKIQDNVVINIDNQNLSAVEKAHQSIVNYIVLQTIILSDRKNKSKRFDANIQTNKQIVIYQILLKIIKIQMRQDKNLIKDEKAYLIESQMINQSKEQKNMIVSSQNQYFSRQKCVESMENYVKQMIDKWINQSNEVEINHYGLSIQCRQTLEEFFNVLAGKNEEEQRIQMIQEKEQGNIFLNSKQANISKQISLLHQSASLYTPPPTLKQLFKQRGKCPNCNFKTNHLVICFICRWKGCRRCKVQPMTKHSYLSHKGRCVFMSFNLGEIFYISSKLHCQLSSLYHDYFGQQLKTYCKQTNLQKYSLNSNSLKKVYKNILNFNIQRVVADKNPS